MPESIVKNLPVAAVIGLIVQALILVWGASQIAADVRHNSEVNVRQEIRLESLESSITEQTVATVRLEEGVKDLDDDLSDLAKFVERALNNAR